MCICMHMCMLVHVQKWLLISGEQAAWLFTICKRQKYQHARVGPEGYYVAISLIISLSRVLFTKLLPYKHMHAVQYMGFVGHPQMGHTETHINVSNLRKI